MRRDPERERDRERQPHRPKIVCLGDLASVAVCPSTRVVCEYSLYVLLAFNNDFFHRVRRSSSDQRIAELQALLALTGNGGRVAHGQFDPLRM